MNTPDERKRAPCFISSRSTFSPSSVMVVSPFASITSARTVQVYRRLPPDSCELSGPRANELAFYQQLALARGVENGNLQHCIYATLV